MEFGFKKNSLFSGSRSTGNETSPWTGGLLDGSQLHMEGLIEVAADGIAVYPFAEGANCPFTGANPAFCALLGYTPEELRKLSPLDVLAPECTSEISPSIQLLQERGLLCHEKVLLTRDGRRIPVEISARLFNQGQRMMVLSVIRDISLRKAMEIAIWESQEGYRHLVESSPNAIVVYQAGRFQYVNDSALKLFGAAVKEQLIGRPFLEVMHPDCHDLVGVLMQTVLETGAASTVHELRINRLDGSQVHVEATGSPISCRGTRVAQVVLHDITERKQAEQEHDMSMEFLRMVNNSSGITDLIHQSLVFFQRESGCEAVGIRLKQGHDYPYFEAKGFPAEFLQAENSLCVRGDDGQPLLDEVGNPVMDCMCGNVICGRFDPCKPFFTAKGSFWSNCTSDLMAQTSEADRQGRTRNRCNGQGYESVALFPLHVGNQRLGLLQLNDHRKGVFTIGMIGMWERLADSLAVALSRFIAEKKLRKAHEELEHRVAERTRELAEALKDLQQKEHMLLQQSRLAAMGEMINNIAHQWRQPLNSLGLNVQRLSLYYERNKFTREFLEKSVETSMMLIQHMSQTIDDFRNFFRPEKEKVPFRVALVVANAISLITGSFNNHNIGIDVECRADPEIHGYPNEYSQVILNLLMNSRDAFRGRSQDYKRVTIKIAQKKGRSFVTVSDNAGGIPVDIIDKVFEPHFTTKGPQGTGIGLFMAKNIIETNMHGRLSVCNTSNGAKFTVEV